MNWNPLFQNYLAAWKQVLPENPYREHDQQTIAAMKSLQQKCSHDKYSRNNFEPGHATGSILIIDPAMENYLLCHHKKLDKWLQLGGHCDGEYDPSKTALKEAQEESGSNFIRLGQWEWLADLQGDMLIDMDIHEIPPYKNDPGHKHFDFRFLAVCDQPETVECSHESNELKWFPFHKKNDLIQEESLARLIAKTALIKEHGEQLPTDWII